MLFMPNSLARRFMSSVKASVLPATFSASATAASLADWTISAYSISSTVKDSFSFSHTREPPVCEALALTGTWSAGESCFCSIFSRTISRSISFRTLAG